MDVFQWAKHYTQLGLSVIPVFYGEKKPLVSWQVYQRRRPSESQLHEWFGNRLPRNIGIVCGGVSGNLVVLDFDSLETYQRFFDDTAKLESETPVVKTSRGLHVWLRTTDKVRSFVLSDLALDVIGESKFVLAPPSRHPSGITYEFVNHIREPMIVDDFLQAIKKRCQALEARIPSIQFAHPTVNQDWTRSFGLKRRRRIAEQDKARVIDAMAPFWTRGRRNQLTMYLSGLFLKRGMAEDDARDIISRICDLASDEEKTQRLAQVVYHYRKDPSVWAQMKGISGLREILD